MKFLVKVTSPRGAVLWLSRARADGTRTIDTKDRAELFNDQAAANAAVGTLSPRPVEGFVISIEPSDVPPLE